MVHELQGGRRGGDHDGECPTGAVGGVVADDNDRDVGGDGGGDDDGWRGEKEAYQKAGGAERPDGIRERPAAHH